MERWASVVPLKVSPPFLLFISVLRTGWGAHLQGLTTVDMYGRSKRKASISDHGGIHGLNERYCYSGGIYKEARRQGFLSNVRSGIS